MSRSVVVDLFVEDQAHEAFLLPIIRRIAQEEGVSVAPKVRSARGGHAHAVSELRAFQRLVEGQSATPMPDLLVVGIDGNCTTSMKKRLEIQSASTPGFATRLVTACPDPHIERWYLADPESFHEVVGSRPTVGKKKCARDHYKDLLSRAVRQAGHPATLGGIEFAAELAAKMDLYRAAKHERSLKDFLTDLRGRLREHQDPSSPA